MELTREEIEIKYDQNFQKFIDGLERLSKKCGIALSIGVSLSSRKVRGGTGLHIGIGITLCFSYIMLNRVFEEFAKGGSLPPMLAVWLPNIIFAFIAIYLYRKAPK